MQKHTVTAESLRLEKATRLLERIRTGMKVFDASDDEIGKVSFVKMGDPEAETVEDDNVGATPGIIVGAPSSSVGDSSGRPLAALPAAPLTDEIASDVPNPIRARLLREGYIRVGGGFLFGKDRYVLAEQIAGIDGDAVKLTVNKEELVI